MRKSTEKTSLMNRSRMGCIDALESVVTERKTGFGVAVLAAGAALLGRVNDDNIGIGLMIMGTLTLAGVYPSKRLCTGLRPNLIKKGDGEKWKIADFHDAEIRERFGFDSATELQDVFNRLRWPERLLVGKGDEKKQYHVNGEQPFLYMLERDHCATKLSLMEFYYGDSYNSIDEQALAAECWLVDDRDNGA